MTLLLLGGVSAQAEETQISTRFGKIHFKESIGPRQTLIKDGKKSFEMDAFAVQQERLFELKERDTVLLRFNHGANSREDSLVFANIDTKGHLTMSTVFRHAHGTQIVAHLDDESVVIDSGYERNVHLFTVYDGNQLSVLKKATKVKEQQSEPVADADCNQLYNKLYIHAFSSEDCSQVNGDIKRAFNTMNYRVMSERSHLLDVEQLTELSTTSCKTKNVLMYNDFKTKVCGYLSDEKPLVGSNPPKAFKWIARG